MRSIQVQLASGREVLNSYWGFLRNGGLVLADPHDLTEGDDVIVDLGGLTFIDSTGMGALVWARNRTQRHGRDIRLRNPQRAVAKTLSVTGLDQVFVIEHEGRWEGGPGAA